MSEEKTEVIDVTGEILQIDKALSQLPAARQEHAVLVSHLNRIIMAVNSSDGFCQIKEPTEQ